MKKVQMAFRIITAPFIFLAVAITLLAFPYYILFMIGFLGILGNLLGMETNESYKDCFFLIFSVVIYPFYCCKQWILEAKLT